ncbi:MAG TPA: hypothetical protein PKW79_05195 [Rhabdochlamydiaceae bacterium]|nr:hypothetical protein [Rhabdochlamydiaceae bacterium]
MAKIKPAPTGETQQQEIADLFEHSSSFSSEKLEKLLNALGLQIQSDSEAQLNALLEFIGKLPQTERAKAMSFLASALPQDEQKKFPTDGTAKEQVDFLVHYMSSLSLGERRHLILSMVKNEVTNSANKTEDSGPTPDEIMDQLDYLLNHITTLSAQQIQELIGKILVDLGIFLSQVQQTSTQISNDQVNVAQAMAKHAQDENKDIQAKIKKMQEEEEAAKSGFWGFLSSLFGNKAFQIILTVVIGLLFCESPIGFVMLAALVTLQATGALDKMTTGLANAMGGGPWANFFAGVIITTLLTGGAGLAEGLGSAAISGLAKGATEAVVEDGAQVGTKAATEVIEKETANEASKITENEGSEAAENAGKDENWLTKSTGYYTNTTAMVLAQSLTQTNLIYNFLIGCGMDKKTAMWVAAVLNVIASIAAMAGALKGSTSTVLDLMSQAGKLGTAFKFTALGIQGLSGVGSSAYGIKEGTTQMDVADIKKQMAPELAQITQLEALSKIFGEMIQVTNNNIANIMKNQSSIFAVNFATGWQAVAQGTDLSA